MPRDRQKAGRCPQCASGDLSCTYNRFDNGPERIESWEHRCLSCNYRDTKAYRSAEAGQAECDPTMCPFCGRRAHCD
jgi:hypothetical protein